MICHNCFENIIIVFTPTTYENLIVLKFLKICKNIFFPQLQQQPAKKFRPEKHSGKGRVYMESKECSGARDVISISCLSVELPSREKSSAQSDTRTNRTGQSRGKGIQCTLFKSGLINLHIQI